MARYIDADALRLTVMRRSIPTADEVGMVTTDDADRYFIKLINDAPIADVVGVVRCKDCKHCCHHIPDYTYPDRTDEVWECVKRIDWVEPDHFCSFGERKENKNK